MAWSRCGAGGGRQRRRDLASAETDAVRVALSGPAAMRDRAMYVALFDPPRLMPAPQLWLGTPAASSARGYHHHGDTTFLAGGFGGADCGGGGGDGGGGC